MNRSEAMEEALNNIGNAAAWVAENCNDQQTAKYMNDIIAMVHSAIVLPRRNCDVGTPEEQAERQHRFCLAHRCGPGCPAWRDGQAHNGCVLAWAQMPYAEEGGAENKRRQRSRIKEFAPGGATASASTTGSESPDRDGAGAVNS